MSAATPGEFYLGLLRRGTASYEANRHTDAVKQLKIAAFGLVDVVDHYQLAQVYLTLTYDKLQDSDRARDAAHRVYLAERIERKYAGLPLPPAVRSAFEALAGKLMSPTESAALLRGAEMPPAAPAPQRVTTVPAQTTSSTPSTPRRTTTTTPQTTNPQPTAPQTKPATQPVSQPTQTVSQPPASQPTQPRNTIPPPKTTTPEKAAPQTAAPTPQPEKPKTVTAAPQPAKPQPTTTTPTPAKTSGTETDGRGGPIEPARPATPPAPVPAPAPRALSASEVATRLATAERSLNAGNLAEARRVYRELVSAPGLDHELMIRVAEGLYRARDFSAALNAFTRVGTLRRGEEPYRYYIAVASYETGDYARAKKELAAALPYIEITPDVARYRTKIEGAS